MHRPDGMCLTRFVLKYSHSWLPAQFQSHDIIVEMPSSTSLQVAAIEDDLAKLVVRAVVQTPDKKNSAINQRSHHDMRCEPVSKVRLVPDVVERLGEVPHPRPRRRHRLVIAAVDQA